jgi:hypothetical protein
MEGNGWIYIGNTSVCVCVIESENIHVLSLEELLSKYVIRN